MHVQPQTTGLFIFCTFTKSFWNSLFVKMTENMIENLLSWHLHFYQRLLVISTPKKIYFLLVRIWQFSAKFSSGSPPLPDFLHKKSKNLYFFSIEKRSLKIEITNRICLPSHSLLALITFLAQKLFFFFFTQNLFPPITKKADWDKTFFQKKNFFPE